ncbi:MAG: exosome complex RNA-binding protein Rrp4 [Candidatus Pacearchaeota archaeon]
MKTKISEDKEVIEESTEAVSVESAKTRKVITPGEIIVSGEDYLPGDGTRREGNNVVASRFGLAEQAGRIVKVIPITGAFIPRRNNVVIGRVIDITFRGWIVDIDSASSGFLPIDDAPRFINKNEMDQFLAIGDVVVAKIFSVSSKGIDLSLRSRGLGKLEGGFIFRVSPNRVPRIIGREGSMISLIKDKTKCNITVGQNGWIWVKGEKIDDELRARRAIEFVAEKVSIEGLTEKMEAWFEKN